MSNKKEDFMSAMFPGSGPANKVPQAIVPVEEETVEEPAIEEQEVNDKPQEETPVVVHRITAREKKAPGDNDRPKSGRKSFQYFCWTSPEIDYKIREIAKRYGISLSALFGEIMETAIENFEKSNGEIVVKEKKVKKTTRR